MQSRPRVSRNRDITRLSRHCVIMAWDARRRRSVRICGLRLVRPGRPRLDRKFGISRVHACPRVLSRLARGGIARLLRRFQFRPVPAVADQHCQDTHAHDRDCERDCRERCSVDAMPITHIHDPITSRDKPAPVPNLAKSWSWFPPPIGQFAGSDPRHISPRDRCGVFLRRLFKSSRALVTALPVSTERQVNSARAASVAAPLAFRWP